MNVKTEAINFIQSIFLLPKKSLRQAYEQGYDCGKNGATLVNCHFSLFQSEAHRDAWKTGSTEGKEGKLIDKEKFNYEG